MGCMVVIGKRGLGEQSELEFGDRGIRFAGTETWGEAERARLTQQRSVRALPLLDVTPWTGELCGPRREQPRRWLTGLRPLPEDLKPSRGAPWEPFHHHYLCLGRRELEHMPQKPWDCWRAKLRVPLLEKM